MAGSVRLSTSLLGRENPTRLEITSGTTKIRASVRRSRDSCRMVRRAMVNVLLSIGVHRPAAYEEQECVFQPRIRFARGRP